MTEPVETWRPIPGFEGYEISDQGRVRSWIRYRYSGPLPRLKAQSLHPHGYRQVTLTRNRRSRGYFVHRLVLQAFHGPRPAGMEARHLNGDALDNRRANLRWGTPRENGQDRVAHGTGNNQHRAKTHCHNGHPFTDANTLIWRGERRCRACHRAAAQRYRDRHRAA